MTDLTDWHASPFVAPPMDRIDRSLGDALLDHVDARPDAVAVIDGPCRYSFAALAARAGGIAAQLAAVDAPAGPVAAIQPIGIDMVATWFACAAAGRPLCLLDPQAPPGRHRELVARAGARILLQAGGAARIEVAGTVCAVPGDATAPLRRGAGLTPDAPAMIFPTSGSTGEPKLVAHSARTLQARVQASIALMGAGPGDRVLIAGAHGNFGYVHHALTFLLAGGTVCLFDLPARGLGALGQALDDAAVRHVRFTPSLFRHAARVPDVVRRLRDLRGLRFSGEPLMWSDVATARAVTAPGCRIQNVYGSTESAIFLWTDDGTAAPASGAAPIGYPYPLWSYALADRTPDGAGHLIVRSGFQAPGDWRDGGPDDGRFPIDPADPALRRYDTGDVVRIEDGQLVALHRRDHLVKINGQRVSLIEVADRLRRMPGCLDAAVLVAEGALAAFVVGDTGLPPSIRSWLMRHLPDHMIPGRIRIVAELPLQPGGKVDLAALHDRLRAGSDGPAATAVIATGPGWPVLERLWGEALGRPGTGFDPASDFFDGGGDSLRLLDLRLALEGAGIGTFDVDRFLERPTMACLAAQLGLSPRPGVTGDPSLAPGVPRFRLLRAAPAPSSGIALVMPGRSGAAVPGPWLAADALPGHDLWACDVAWPAGHMLHGHRWIDVAQAIAAAIGQGQIPRPAILLGFSIAGCIGWLVDRLLAATALRPDRIIVLDSAPMHRRRGPCRRRLDRLLARTVPPAPPAMLLIRRCTAAPARLADVTRAGWTAADAAIEQIVVGTVDHADMNTHVVLRAAGAALQAVPAGPSPPGGSATIAVDSPGGRLHAMLVAADPVTPGRIDALFADPSRAGSFGTLAATLYVAIVHGRVDQIADAIAAMREVAPQSSAARLAAVMLPRHDRYGADLIASQGPYVVLGTMTAVRHAFGLRARAAGRHDTGLYRRTLLALSIARQYARLRTHNQVYRLSGWRQRIAGAGT